MMVYKLPIRLQAIATFHSLHAKMTDVPRWHETLRLLFAAEYDHLGVKSMEAVYSGPLVVGEFLSQTFCREKGSTSMDG